MFDGDSITQLAMPSTQHRILESVDDHLLVPFVEDESEHVGSKDDEDHHAKETDSLKGFSKQQRAGEN